MIVPTDALILLDTNILVHLLRGDVVGQRLAVDYDLFNRPNQPLISFVTVGEMYALASFDHLHERYVKRAKINVKTGETLN